RRVGQYVRPPCRRACGQRERDRYGILSRSCSELECFDGTPLAHQERVGHDLKRREIDIALAIRCEADEPAIERRIFRLQGIDYALITIAHLRATARQDERSAI